MARIAVIGTGLVGRRAARILAGRGHDVVLVGRSAPAPDDPDRDLVRRWGRDPVVGPVDGVLLATESLQQVVLAERWIDRGVGVVATADRPEALRGLWTLRDRASQQGVGLSAGVACAPGLSTLLVKRLVDSLAEIDAITTARFGTGGPTCAREHHRSMAAPAFEVRAHQARWARGGSGRALVWFPEPVGPQDCYRAGLGEAFLLRQAFRAVPRIQVLQAATRRDRLTARLPMLRPPHAEGLVGGVWVEVRGRDGEGRVEHRVVAATGPQATIAAEVAASVAGWQFGIDGLTGDPLQWVSGGEPLAWLGLGAQVLDRLGVAVRLWGYDGTNSVASVSSGPVQVARKRQSGASLPRPGRWVVDALEKDQGLLPKVKDVSTD